MITKTKRKPTLAQKMKFNKDEVSGIFYAGMLFGCMSVARLNEDEKGKLSELTKKLIDSLGGEKQ